MGPGIAGGSRALPDPVASVVDVEEQVAPEPKAAVNRAAFTVCLFRPDEEPRQVDLASLPQLVSRDENFVWIDLSTYTQSDLAAVAGLLNLDPVGIHLAGSAWQRPHLDVFHDHFFVTATVARLDSAAYRIHAGQLDLFVGCNYLVSAHKLPLPFSDRIMARAAHSPEVVQHDSAFMLYIILDELLAYYEDLNESMQHEIEMKEEQALSETSDKFLRDILHLKRYAFALSQLLEQHHNVFEAFLRPDFPFVTGEEVNIYYRDLEGRLSRLLETLARGRDAINGAFDIYVSHVSYRTNHIMRVLTVVSTTLLPMTVILGIFSTSIQGLPLTEPWAFAIMISVMLLISSTILLTFHRRGWI